MSGHWQLHSAVTTRYRQMWRATWIEWVSHAPEQMSYDEIRPDIRRDLRAVEPIPQATGCK